MTREDKVVAGLCVGAVVLVVIVSAAIIRVAMDGSQRCEAHGMKLKAAHSALFCVDSVGRVFDVPRT